MKDQVVAALGVAAVVAAVGSLAVRAWLREERAPRTTAAARRDPAPPEPPPPAAQPAPVVGAPAPVPPPAPLPPPRPALAAPDPRPRPEAAPRPEHPPAPVVRGESLHNLGPVGAQLMRGLNALRGRLAACVEEDQQSGPDRPGRRPGMLPRKVAGVVLVLDVETLDGAVRIVDAQAPRQGTKEGAADCAQRILGGLTLPAPAAQAGERHRVEFSP